MDSAATNPQTPRPQPSRNARGPAAGASASPAPTPRATHVVGEPVVFDGYVDDFENNIAAMQFSLDDGATWTTYKTLGVTADKGVNWHFSYTPTRPGRYLLKARAVDGAGNASALVASYAFEVQP